MTPAHQSPLQKRARKKLISQSLAGKLAAANPESPLLKSYKNSWWCNNDLVPDENGILHAHLCGNRWCLVCNAIKTAQQINNYAPQLAELAKTQDPYFVTLTRPTCEAEELPAQVNRMKATLRKIKNTESNKLRQVDGIVTFECTHSRGKFHFHIHLLIFGKENAEKILKLWLKENPDSSPLAQNIKPADLKDPGSLKEMFKYMTKIIGRQRKDGGERTPAFISPKALDTIFRALYRKQLIGIWGGKIKAPKKEINEEEFENGTKSNEIWRWEQQAHDWINRETGEILTGYNPSPAIRALVGLPEKDSEPTAVPEVIPKTRKYEPTRQEREEHELNTTRQSVVAELYSQIIPGGNPSPRTHKWLTEQDAEQDLKLIQEAIRHNLNDTGSSTQTPEKQKVSQTWSLNYANVSRPAPDQPPKRSLTLAEKAQKMLARMTPDKRKAAEKDMEERQKWWKFQQEHGVGALIEARTAGLCPY